MDMKPESDRYQATITQLALLMDRVHYMVIESQKIQQNTLYFNGYFDGLRYALSIVQLTEKEESYNEKAEIKLVIEDNTVTFECDNMDQITMKDLVDCLQVMAGSVKMNGGTDLLIMASVVFRYR